MYLPSIIMYVFIHFQILNACLHLKAKDKNRNLLEQCLVNIVRNSTSQKDTIFIINYELLPYLWTELIETNSKLQERYSFIQNSCTSSEQFISFDRNLKENAVSVFLIHVKTPDELKSLLKNLQSYHIFNSRVNFLVTSTTKFENRTRTLSSIFEILWQANIYNSLVVLPHRTDNSKTDLMTWYPYTKRNCLIDFSKYKRIDYCSNGRLQRNKDLYPNKIPDKLKGCGVKVRTVVWPPFVMKPTKRINNTDTYVFKQGFEIVLMNTIAESMNLNLTYTLSEKSINWGELYDNGSATGMQAFLLQNEGDIGLSSQAYTQSRLKFFDVGTPYFYEYLVWCVPYADTIPPLEKIIEGFSLATWILNIFSFVIFTILYWLLNKLGSRNSSCNFITCIQNAFSMLLGIPIYTLPKICSVKILLCFWFVFTMHLNIIYRTSLVSILTNPVYRNQINTLEEILQTDLRLQFMPSMKRYFDDNQNHSKEILERWIDCIDLNDCIDRVAYTKDSVILLPKLYLEFIKNKYKKKHGSYIFCFNGKIMTYPGSMIMRKGFPLRNRMNMLIFRMLSAGLVDTWQKDALSINLSSNKTLIFGQEEVKVITFKAQEPAFICLTLGLMVATAVFICELILAKCRRSYVVTCYN